MDYFQSQDVARRKTGLLVVYFVMAVILIILMVYLAIQACTGVRGSLRARRGRSARSSDLWNPELFGVVALGTSALIAGGSLYKIAALSGGGHTVAELLGGRLLHPDGANPDERRLLNVVEEMAIASGLPVPPVYLLENEPGINAFAAGHTPGDAVIAVTSGTLQAALARRAAGRRRARVQPHLERRHAAQHPADGRALRHPHDRTDRLADLPQLVGRVRPRRRPRRRR